MRSCAFIVSRRPSERLRRVSADARSRSGKSPVRNPWETRSTTRLASASRETSSISPACTPIRPAMQSPHRDWVLGRPSTDALAQTAPPPAGGPLRTGRRRAWRCRPTLVPDISQLLKIVNVLGCGIRPTRIPCWMLDPDAATGCVNQQKRLSLFAIALRGRFRLAQPTEDFSEPWLH